MNEERRNIVEERERVDHIPYVEEVLRLNDRGEETKALIEVVYEKTNRPRRVDEQEYDVGCEYGDEEHIALALGLISVCCRSYPSKADH